jgi:parallel beta-helix repeat protein
MKKAFILLILATFICPVVDGQVLPPMEVQAIIDDSVEVPDDGINCPLKSSAFINKYHDLYNTDLTYWMPQPTDAIKYIKVNFIVYQLGDGTGNFSQNGVNPLDPTKTDIQFLNELIDHVNLLYSNLADPSDIGGASVCGSCNTIKDTRIRFQLSGIHFYPDATAYGTSGVYYSINPQTEINIYLTGLNVNYSWADVSSFNQSQKLTVFLNRLYYDYTTYGYNHALGSTQWLAHELGHSLGLCHTYYGGGCPITTQAMIDQGFYFDDHFGIHPSNYCPDRNGFWNSDPWLSNNDFITNNIMSYTVTRQYLTSKQIAVIHRNLSLKSIRKYVDHTTFLASPVEIVEDETWDFDFRIYRDIIVKNQSVLTLTCVLRMPPGGRIIIEPGSKLIVDGGLITSYGDYFWHGIEVWGNNNLSQIPVDAQTQLRLYQGEIQVINGGTIENAINAIAAIKTNPGGNKDWSKTGGVIILDDANMKNNNFDVWIGAYHNIHPTSNKELNNYSRIHNSKFEKNDNMPAGYNGYAFIGLWDVGTISIKGNTFKNLKTNLNTQDRGRGIVAYSATINLTDYCPNASSMYIPLSQSQATNAYPTPCTGAVRNHFEGLYYGVWASNVTGLPNTIIHIDRANFKDVYHGIYIQNAKYSSVTRCDFEIPSTDPAAFFSNSAITHAYGIYLDGSDGYRIEENKLFNNSGPLMVRGIVVNESGVSNNEIYGNTLESTLGYAIQAQGNNRGGNRRGLGLFCNEMAENLSDIVVLDNGIKVHQLITNGSSQYAAGNIFTSCVSNSYQNYNNQSAATIFYYADGNNVPQCVYNVNFPYNLTPLTRSCPSKLANTFPNLVQNLVGARLAYNSAVTMLHIWQDGGNANLEYEVETTLPWEVYLQFNELMSMSPYLSDEVILAAINNDAFSSLMIKLLMAANTHALHNPEIMQAIFERVPAMPESYIAEIESGFDQVSQLDLLRGDVAATRHLVDVLTNDIKRHYQMEFEDGEDVLEEYIDFIASINTLDSKYELAALYLQKGDFTSIAATLDSIPFIFELDELQQEDHANWQIYFEIASDFKQSGIYPDSLSATQISDLEAIAELEFSRVAPAARALLMLNQHGFEYKEEVKPVPEYTPRKRNPKSGIQKAQASTLKVYPNPCNDYTTLEYRTGDKYNNLRVELTDALGKTVFSQKLKGGDNEELLSLSKLRPGVYLLKLIGDNAVVDTQRITISR